jgi:hypothetical protein
MQNMKKKKYITPAGFKHTIYSLAVDVLISGDILLCNGYLNGYSNIDIYNFSNGWKGSLSSTTFLTNATAIRLSLKANARKYTF